MDRRSFFHRLTAVVGVFSIGSLIGQKSSSKSPHDGKVTLSFTRVQDLYRVSYVRHERNEVKALIKAFRKNEKLISFSTQFDARVKGLLAVKTNLIFESLQSKDEFLAALRVILSKNQKFVSSPENVGVYIS